MLHEPHINRKNNQVVLRLQGDFISLLLHFSKKDPFIITLLTVLLCAPLIK
jgi:hypothetical protein